MMTAMIASTIPTQRRNCSDSTSPPVIRSTTATTATMMSRRFIMATFLLAGRSPFVSEPIPHLGAASECGRTPFDSERTRVRSPLYGGAPREIALRSHRGGPDEARSKHSLPGVGYRRGSPPHRVPALAPRHTLLSRVRLSRVTRSRRVASRAVQCRPVGHPQPAEARVSGRCHPRTAIRPRAREPAGRPRGCHRAVAPAAAPVVRSGTRPAAGTG